jgi:lactate dehydrogenase-like 2-hydroxyacid dehydrogenase
MKKILMAYRFKEECLKDLEGKYEIVLPKDKSHFTRNEVLEMIPEFEVLVPILDFITDSEIMDKGSKLELISNFGVGFDNI